MNGKLSPKQRQILGLMVQYGAAAFNPGQKRQFAHKITETGLVIYCYQQPEYFLKHRQLIEKVDREFPGEWYQLTPAGRERAKRIRLPI